MVNIEKEKKAQNANVSHRSAENPNARTRGLSHSSVNIGTIDPLYFLIPYWLKHFLFKTYRGIKNNRFEDPINNRKLVSFLSLCWLKIYSFDQ
jgi:hypothetical protein